MSEPRPTPTSYETTELCRIPPEIIEPAPTIESWAAPPSLNFAGGSDGGFVSNGHSRL